MLAPDIVEIGRRLPTPHCRLLADAAGGRHGGSAHRVMVVAGINSSARR
jgi:hypothetical protein